jgi:hypothetical protein
MAEFIEILKGLPLLLIFFVLSGVAAVVRSWLRRESAQHTTDVSRNPALGEPACAICTKPTTLQRGAVCRRCGQLVCRSCARHSVCARCAHAA